MAKHPFTDVIILPPQLSSKGAKKAGKAKAVSTGDRKRRKKALASTSTKC